MCGTNKIHKLSLDNNTLSIIYEDIYNDFEGIPTRLVTVNSELYILCNTLLYKLESNTNNVNLALNLLLNNEVDNTVDISQFQFFISKLRKQNIKVSINFEEISNYTEKLCTKLYSKDDTFDLFITDLNDLHKINTKYCISLDNNQAINNTMGQMFSHLKKLTTYDNHLIAVPYDLSYTVFCINPNLAEKYSINIDTMNQLSWSQFFDLCEANAIDNNQDGNYDIWLTEWTYDQILTEMINQTLAHTKSNTQENIFDNETFKNLLLRLKELTLKGIILDNTNELDYNNSILLSTSCLSLVSEKNQGHFILPPVFNTKEPCYMVDGKALCINANSNYSELAEQLLLEVIKPENNIPYGGLPIYNDQDSCETIYNAFLEAYPGMPNGILEGTRLEMTDEIFNKCTQLGENMYSKSIYYLPTTLHALIKDFIYEDVDIQTVLDVLNSEIEKNLEL